jgi:hypothetical protein
MTTLCSVQDDQLAEDRCQVREQMVEHAVSPHVHVVLPTAPLGRSHTHQALVFVCIAPSLVVGGADIWVPVVAERDVELFQP